MAEQNTQSLPFNPGHQPAAHGVASTACWLGIADDLAFGCECADPALQIDRWREEALMSPSSSS
jgi:hypothetical protein